MAIANHRPPLMVVTGSVDGATCERGRTVCVAGRSGAVKAPPASARAGDEGKPTAIPAGVATARVGTSAPTRIRCDLSPARLV